MERVNTQSKQQVKSLNTSLHSQQQQHQTMLGQEEARCDQLTDKLLEMENELTKLRVRAGEMQI